MKTNTLLVILAMLTTSLSFHAQILFDQTSSVVTGGIASQDFETASNQYDCMAADEILIPTGQHWTIDSILILGQYSAGATTPTGMRLTFYSDSSGHPGPVHSQYEWGSDIDQNGDGDCLLKFDCSIRMEPGLYWMEARAVKTFGSGGGQWYWTRDSLGSGLEFQWKNPPNGFATGCTSYGPISSCVTTIPHHGTSFTIYGCAGGPAINSMGNDTAFCEGPSLLLDPGTGGLSNPIFSWSTGDSTQTVIADSSHNYRVSVTDPNTGCYSVSCRDLTVHPIPVSGITDTGICAGGTFAFFAFAGNSVVHTWWPNDTVSNVYLTDEEGYVSVSMVDTITGCSNVDSAYLSVIDDPDPTITGEPSVQVCEGDSLVLAITENWASYLWSTGSDSNSTIVSEAGFYFVTVTTPEGCIGHDSLEVNTIPPPEIEITIDTVSPGFGIRLNAPEGYNSYLWSNGATERRTVIGTTGTYSVTVTDQFGCTGEAEAFVVVTGIDDPEMMGGVEVFPNPARDQVMIRMDEVPSSGADVRLFDASGRVLISTPLHSNNQALSLRGIAPGYYLLHLRDGQKQRVVPVLVE